jgi:carbonic anhydrase/acetyltransferase-like protein (isoleucine patch superfamily)
MAPEPIRPEIGRNVFIAPTAYVGGKVTLGDDVTIMHHVVIRGDVSAITVGPRVNIQDGAIVHTRSGVPLDIAADVSIGHRAVVHGRRIGPRTLIGIGAIMLDDSEIGAGCIIAAGALIPPGTTIPDGKLVAGLPGRIQRDVTEADRRYLERITASYVDLNRQHAAGRYPNAAADRAP